jgi:hypothetical protein
MSIFRTFYPLLCVEIVNCDAAPPVSIAPLGAFRESETDRAPSLLFLNLRGWRTSGAIWALARKTDHFPPARPARLEQVSGKSHFGGVGPPNLQNAIL